VINDDTNKLNEIKRLRYGEHGAQNERLISSIRSRVYEYTYPIQVRDGRKLNTLSTRRTLTAAIPPSSSNNVTSTSSPFATSTGAASSLGSQLRVPQHYDKTSVQIKAFNYRFCLELELNANLFGASLIQKHLLPMGAQQITTHELEHCYYHARSQADAYDSATGAPAAAGAFGALRTCHGGISGVIHIDNDTFVIHPMHGGNQTRQHPHIIYRYDAEFNANLVQAHWPGAHQVTPEQVASAELTGTVSNNMMSKQQSSTSTNWAQPRHSVAKPVPIGSSLLSNGNGPNATNNRKWPRNHRATKWHHEGHDNSNNDDDNDEDEDELFVELGLVLASDLFQVAAYGHSALPALALNELHTHHQVAPATPIGGPTSPPSRLQVIHDAVQVINCVDLYFRRSAAHARITLAYIETWAHTDQMAVPRSLRATLRNFDTYARRQLAGIPVDVAHLLLGGRQFDDGTMGVARQASVCRRPNEDTGARADGAGVSVSTSARDDPTYEPHLLAATVAHLIGHTLGVDHPSVVGGNGQQQRPVRQAPGMSTSTKGSHTSTRGTLLTRVTPALASVSDTSSTTCDEPVAATTDASVVGVVSRDDSPAPEAETLAHEDSIKNSRLLQKDTGSTVSRTTRSVIHEKFAFASAEAGLDVTDGRYGTWGEDYERGGEAGGSGYAGNGSIDNVDHCTIRAGVPPVPFTRAALQALRRQVVHGGHTPCLLNRPLLMHTRSAGSRAHDYDAVDSGDDDNTNESLGGEPTPEVIEVTLGGDGGVGRSGTSKCGNGIVDAPHEQCDCGTHAQCLALGCCDASTCRWARARAQCSHGACCTNECRLRAAGVTCRAPADECDFGETCDGVRPQCPWDAHWRDGTPCARGTSLCVGGVCGATHDAQCASAWPELEPHVAGARAAERVCFSEYNIEGSPRGHCGLAHIGSTRSPMSLYRKCRPADIMCGALQCQGGVPLVSASSGEGTSASASSKNANSSNTAQSGTGAKFARTTIYTGGVEYECKVITSPGVWRLVADGTKCAPHSVCLNQTCVELPGAEALDVGAACACSRHGHCDNAQQCHCDTGWTGSDCSQPTSVRTPVVVTPVTLVVATDASDVTPTSTTLTSPIITDTNSTVADNGTTTSTSDTNNSSHTTSVAPAVAAPTQVHEGRLRSSLTAGQCVVIMVLIVGGVFVLFALVANCYRRDGLLKPDKVLRHHRMSCRMDAMRTAMLARGYINMGPNEPPRPPPNPPPVTVVGGGSVRLRAGVHSAAAPLALPLNTPAAGVTACSALPASAVQIPNGTATNYGPAPIMATVPLSGPVAATPPIPPTTQQMMASSGGAWPTISGHAPAVPSLSLQQQQQRAALSANVGGATAKSALVLAPRPPPHGPQSMFIPPPVITRPSGNVAVVAQQPTGSVKTPHSIYNRDHEHSHSHSHNHDHHNSDHSGPETHDPCWSDDTCDAQQCVLGPMTGGSHATCPSGACTGEHHLLCDDYHEGEILARAKPRTQMAATTAAAHYTPSRMRQQVSHTPKHSVSEWAWQQLDAESLQAPLMAASAEQHNSSSTQQQQQAVDQSPRQICHSSDWPTSTRPRSQTRTRTTRSMRAQLSRDIKYVIRSEHLSSELSNELVRLALLSARRSSTNPASCASAAGRLQRAAHARPPLRHCASNETAAATAGAKAPRPLRLRNLKDLLGRLERLRNATNNENGNCNSITSLAPQHSASNPHLFHGSNHASHSGVNVATADDFWSLRRPSASRRRSIRTASARRTWCGATSAHEDDDHNERLHHHDHVGTSRPRPRATVMPHGRLELGEHSLSDTESLEHVQHVPRAAEFRRARANGGGRGARGWSSPPPITWAGHAHWNADTFNRNSDADADDTALEDDEPLLDFDINHDDDADGADVDDDADNDVNDVRNENDDLDDDLDDDDDRSDDDGVNYEQDDNDAPEDVALERQLVLDCLVAALMRRGDRVPLRTSQSSGTRLSQRQQLNSSASSSSTNKALLLLDGLISPSRPRPRPRPRSHQQQQQQQLKRRQRSRGANYGHGGRGATTSMVRATPTHSCSARDASVTDIGTPPNANANSTTIRRVLTKQLSAGSTSTTGGGDAGGVSTGPGSGNPDTPNRQQQVIANHNHINNSNNTGVTRWSATSSTGSPRAHNNQTANNASSSNDDDQVFRYTRPDMSTSTTSRVHPFKHDRHEHEDEDEANTNATIVETAIETLDRLQQQCVTSIAKDARHSQNYEKIGNSRNESCSDKPTGVFGTTERTAGGISNSSWIHTNTRSAPTVPLKLNSHGDAHLDDSLPHSLFTSNNDRF
ncbi:Disintegrin and metalloproteinase domain-containing protein 21, partial [Fragariocoptes setiger]